MVDSLLKGELLRYSAAPEDRFHDLTLQFPKETLLFSRHLIHNASNEDDRFNV